MRGEFETDNLSNLIELTARNIEVIYKFSGLLDFPIINFLKNKIIKNTKSRSKENIAKHYDLGNDFFSLWLDDTLTYSSAIFDDKSKNLSDAQNNKYLHYFYLFCIENCIRSIFFDLNPASQ